MWCAGELQESKAEGPEKAHRLSQAATGSCYFGDMYFAMTSGRGLVVLQLKEDREREICIHTERSVTQ